MVSIRIGAYKLALFYSYQIKHYYYSYNLFNKIYSSHFYVFMLIIKQKTEKTKIIANHEIISSFCD